MGLVAARNLAVLHGTVCAVLLFGYLELADLAGLPLAAALEARIAPLAIAALLALVVFAIAAIPSRVAFFVAVAVSGAQLALLLLDRPLFRLTRLHFSPRIFRVLMQPDALAGIGIDAGNVASAVGLIVLGAGLAAALAVGARKLGERRAIRAFALSALGLTAVDRAVYSFVAPAWFSESNDPAAVLPLAGLVSFRLPNDTIEAFGLHGFYDRRAREHIEPVTAPSAFQYPALAAHDWKPGAGKPRDVLYLAVESFRAAQFDAETTPNLWALAQRSCWSPRHYASANWTHLSLFSLLTGMSPRSWAAFAEQNRPPFTYELLRRAGYQLSVTSSQEPSWFGLHGTVFPKELALNTYRNAIDADETAVGDLIRLFSQPHDRPLFAFMFLNDTHFPYYVPPGGELFTPSAKEFRVTDPDLKGKRDEVLNRYRNSLHHVDALIGRLLETVGPDTVIAVTADHGESFWEDGRFTHTSLLSQVQLHVPFILHAPGREPCTFAGTTSHPDVMPSVLAAAGVELAPSAWSDGDVSGTAPNDRPALAMQFDVDEPSDYALVGSDRIVRFKLDRGAIRPRDAEWLDGRPGAAPDADDPLIWARLLAELHRVTRWWPR